MEDHKADVHCEDGKVLGHFYPANKDLFIMDVGQSHLEVNDASHNPECN